MVYSGSFVTAAYSDFLVVTRAGFIDGLLQVLHAREAQRVGGFLDAPIPLDQAGHTRAVAVGVCGVVKGLARAVPAAALPATIPAIVRLSNSSFMSTSFR